MAPRAPVMFPNPGQERGVHKAWESVVQGGSHRSDVLRDLIDHSWQRCLRAKVDPRQAGGPHPVPEDHLAMLREQRHDLLAAGDPAMACARDYLAETGSIMLLTDEAGHILAAEGDDSVKDKAAQIHLAPGSRWNEAASGTNAIGTALEIGQPVHIHSAEHFCAAVQHWTCAAAVIRHPTDGEILGVLDVSGLSSSFNRQSLALAVSTGKRVETRLAIMEMERRYRLLEASIGLWRSMGQDGAVLFDRRGIPIKANEAAARAIADAGGNNSWLRQMARQPALAQWAQRRDDVSCLPGWLRPEWLHPLMVQGQCLGMMMVVPQSRSAPVRAGGQGRFSLAEATSGELVRTTDFFSHVVHGDGAMSEVMARARQLAPARTSVLLQGETGVGKEGMVRGLHGDRKGACVALNCGGLSRELLASELFGHVEGAFTGARKGGMPGKIEAAQGGTLFLDEIGEMPLEMQPMLLRVLDQGEVCRLGETQPRKVDFRLIAATHRDLRAEVSAGRFRMDLFYRIAVATLRIPPLRERREDIVPLAEHFLQRLRFPDARGVESAIGAEAPERLSSDVTDCLQAYAWPGNVRELRNVIEAAVVLAGHGALQVQMLPAEVQAAGRGVLADESAATTKPGAPLVEASALAESRDATLDAAGRRAILHAIAAEDGNLTQAARRLAIAKSTLYLKMRAYGITRDSVLRAADGR